MSWQVGAFAVLGLALAGGFWWYERARPDARIVALVGTLAAFAALGRIAFAAVPNVKPTTDIVLIAGFALGGGPGFAVGAIAGLTSNFFFGQGPWTPWQMAAWGATGIIGAALAALLRRRRGSAAASTTGQLPQIGRWPLAIICGVVGFAFTAVQDAGDWVNYSDHGLGALGAYVGQGLGFDAIHCAGCVAFALAVGPALIRSVQRFALRLHVEWDPVAAPAAPRDRAAPPGAGGTPRGAIAGILLTIGLLGVVTTPARASTTAQGAAVAGTQYLLRAQNSDGGFGPAPGQSSDQLDSGWAALGLASAGVDLADVTHAGGSLIAYVARGAGTGDVGSLERTILVIRAAGLSARNVGGRDLVAELERHIRGDGSVSDQVNLTSFAILALRAAGSGVPRSTLRWLAAQSDRDGGFNFAQAGGPSDVDDTGAALEALASDRAAGAVRRAAVAYLRRQQDRDGGFSDSPGAGSNAQSTAWAVQGLIAGGVAPDSVRRAASPSPLAYLEALSAPSGLIRYSRGLVQTPVWVTGEAIMALRGRPLPLAAPETEHQPSHALMRDAARLLAAPVPALEEAVGRAMTLALAPIGMS